MTDLHPTVPPKIQRYSFSLTVDRVELQTSLADHLRVGFKIGPKEVVMAGTISLHEGKSNKVPDQMLELSSEVLLNQLSRSYQPLKAIVKVYLLTDKGERLGGVVYLNLDDFLNSYSSLGRSIEVPIMNSPDANAKLCFNLQLIDLDEHSRFERADLPDESVHSIKEESSELDISSRLNDDVQNITEVFDIKSYLNNLQEIDTLKAEKQQIQKQSRRLQQIVRALSSEEITLKRNLLEAREELRQVRSDNQRKQERIKQLTQDRQSLQSNEAYRELQDAFSRAKWEHEQELSRLKDQNLFLKCTIDDSKKIEENLKDRIDELNKELSGLDKSKLDSLRAKNKELEGMNKQLREEIANQKSKLSVDYTQREIEHTQKIKSLEQKLMNASSGVTRSRADSSFSCPKCKSLEEDFNAKFQNYEEQLQVLQNILYESKNETRKYQVKLEDRTRKCRFYEEVAGQIRQYKECLQFALDKLISLNKSLGDEKILKKSEDHTEPFGFRAIFEQLVKEARENMYFKPDLKRKMSFQLQDQVNKERIELLEEVRTKEKELAKISSNLASSHSRIEQLQQELDLARGALETLRAQYTKLADMEQKPFEERLTFGMRGEIMPQKFNEISFSKLPQTDQEHDHAGQAKHIITKLLEEKRLLEQQLKLFKSGGTVIQKRPSRQGDFDKELLSKLDDNFTLENEPERIPGDFKQLYNGLIKDYEQLSHDYQQIKKEADLYREQNNRLKLEQDQLKRMSSFKRNQMAGGLHVIEEENTAEDEVRDQIKNLIDSLDTPNGTSGLHNNTDEASHGTQVNRPALLEIRQELERKLRGLELQLVLAHSTMFSVCSSNQQTHQTLNIFSKFHKLLEELRSYVETIGR